MESILILPAVLSFAANQLMTRTFQVRIEKRNYAINLYQAAFTLVAAIAYLIFALATGSCFFAELLLPALLFGIGFSLASLFSAKCMAMGYMSLTSVIVNLSLILPVIFSWMAMGEDVTANAVIGLLLILLTLVLSSLSAGQSGSADIKIWLPFVMIAFLANGSTAILQKQYKANYGEEELMLFMGIAYLVSALIFAGVYLSRCLRAREHVREQMAGIRYLPLLALVSGLGSFGGNALLGYLCDKIDGAILYPCLNGGLCVTVALASFLIFREKPSVRKLLAVAIGVLAIVILNL